MDFPSSSFEKLLAAQQDALRQIHRQPDCWQLLVQLAANLQDPSSLADALVDAANAGGGRDNISVLLVQVGGDARKRGFLSRLMGA